MAPLPHSSAPARLYEQGIAALDAGRHAEAVIALEQALAGNPGDPATLYALGEAAAQLGLHQTAARFFQEVLIVAPDRHEATIRLSRALSAMMRHGDAVDALRDALARFPEQAGLWLALGNTVRETGDIDNAVTFYREALRLNPGSVEARGNLADLIFDAGEITEALALYDDALRRAPANAQLHVNRGLALLTKGDIDAGWRDYEWRLKIPARVIERTGAPKRWDGAPRKGRTLLVMAEQGVGDQLAFASFLPQLLEDGPVILECEPRLVPMFARSLPRLKVRPSVIKREGATLRADYTWLREVGGAALSIELASLPRRCGGKPRDPQPWLKPDPAERDAWLAWRRTLGHERVVAISWRSGLKGGLRDTQYAPLARWAQFIGKLDAAVVVAQYGQVDGEIETLEALSGRKLHIPPALDQKLELDRTAALLSAMDAIVSAPTAVASIAGALGVPTYKVLHLGSWTAMGADREPFTPSVVCVTPDHAGQWRLVFERVLSRLGPA
ncbi:MAG: glycosyltransferase family protein [Alphaproteobacteria bacterium]|nr:glycosyltransferase family protein [Alphaproteobacteria bacterium]